MTVALLDRVDFTLHRPATGRGNLVTFCGLQLGRCTAGRIEAIIAEAVRLCPDCWAAGTGETGHFGL